MHMMTIPLSMPLGECYVLCYMHDVDVMSRCIYKMLYSPFWTRGSGALVFNIESDNNMSDPPECSSQDKRRDAQVKMLLLCYSLLKDQWCTSSMS